MELTVETLREKLKDVPGDLLVEIDFMTDYDGSQTERTGLADDCIIIRTGKRGEPHKLVISAGDWKGR